MKPENTGLDLLPSEMARDAVDLADVGVNEWAIPTRHARAACQILSNSGLAILGGDYWLRHGDGFQSAADGWATREKPGEEWSVFVRRTLAEAERAIEVRTTAYSELDSYLVLIAVSEEDYRRLQSMHVQQ